LHSMIGLLLVILHAAVRIYKGKRRNFQII
jgi:hypothetical protein